MASCGHIKHPVSKTSRNKMGVVEKSANKKRLSEESVVHSNSRLSDMQAHITLHYIGLCYIASHRITSHRIALHCIALHCIILDYIALHCIALHYCHRLSARDICGDNFSAGKRHTRDKKQCKFQNRFINTISTCRRLGLKLLAIISKRCLPSDPKNHTCIHKSLSPTSENHSW